MEAIRPPLRRIAILFLLVAVGWELNDAFGAPERLRIEKRAAYDLRAIGSAQLAYQDQNLDKNYGSFHQLQRAGYLPVDASYDTLIPRYRLAVWSYYPIEYQWQGCGADSSFTLIALPRRRGLRTFGMIDDLVPRQAPGEGAAIIETRPESENQNRLWELQAAGEGVAAPTCPANWRPVLRGFADPPSPPADRWRRWWHRFLLAH